ncbi:MAG: MarR family transcriptional regulator [Polyangiaceae bacterium]
MKTTDESSWDAQAAPVSFWINHASRLLTRHFEQQLRPLDFGMAYLPVVIALKKHGTLLQAQLAELARVEQSTMAALLTRMQRDGLIVREQDPDDGRAARVSLSAKAKARLPAAKQLLDRIGARATAGFSERERETLAALLQRVVTNLEEQGETERTMRALTKPRRKKRAAS